MKTDFLVIGSGIAGLTFAYKTASKFPEKKILVLSKTVDANSNSSLAQGGIAIVQSDVDSIQKHIEDTLICGDGLCDPKIVKMVVNSGSDCLSFFESIGVDFDKNKKGEFDLGREGGHTENRVLHHKDITGKELIRALIYEIRKLGNIEFLEHHFAIDLIISDKTSKQKETCIGASVFDELKMEIATISAKITVIATGGAGQIFQTTTNPIIATGDGIAMASRAGAKIVDLEFIQFHPTAFYSLELQPSFLISEAIRGAGALLRNIKGERFMEKYDPRLELASRDVVSQAIVSEMQLNHSNFVYLDCTKIQKNTIRDHFPNIFDKCLSLGLDINKEFIPVVPAAHYVCGGIQVDENGGTSIQNFYAIGECSRTGLHGANRLASNSLLEAYVFADRCSKNVSKKIELIQNEELNPIDFRIKNSFLDIQIVNDLKSQLQKSMSSNVGVVRTNKSLENAYKTLLELDNFTNKAALKSQFSKEVFELKNLLEVAMNVVIQSKNRAENKGSFYNRDLRY